ncbi:hypothetical protein F5Y05DRAFT_126739 [Hypoxylon sp. FL0543]|nr:hypothetical protein F5Y05DRAFT_126739 [Hypoxylon sp. FL0543]
MMSEYSGYSCRDERGDDPFGCWSFFAGPETFSVSTFSFATDSAGLTTRVDAGTTTEIWSTNYIRAYGPIVRHVAGEIRATPSSSVSTPTQSTSSISTPTTSTTPATTSTSGLSTGAAAGIGVGCGVGALVLIGTAAFLFMRRRKRRAQSEVPTQPAYESDKSQWNYQPQQSYPYELYGEQESRPNELNGEQESRPHELNAERE